MKKMMLALLVCLSALMLPADTITNYVYVVSNQYFRQVREITNRVSTVTYKTNVTVSVDVSNAAIARAEYEADRAERAVENAESIADAAAASASAAASSASSAQASSQTAYSYYQNTASAAASGLNAINNRIAWFDQHSGETITVVNVQTNVNYDYHVAQTVVTNDFRHVPYDNDSGIEVDLNSLSVKAKGGTNNVYRVSAPGNAWGSSQTAVSYFDMAFDRFELVDGKGKYWYKAAYWPTPYASGTCVTWRFLWACWIDGEWHVALDQETYSDGSKTDSAVYEMTLSASYPNGTGTLSNRPRYSWTSTSFGNLSVISSSTNMMYVSRIALQSQVDSAIASLSSSVDRAIETSVAEVGTRVGNAETEIDGHDTAIGQLNIDVAGLGNDIQALGNRVTEIETGSPHAYEHGGTVYQRITVYNVAQDSGKVSADPTSSSSYAAASYKLTPAYRYPTTDVGTWTFVPAYVDTDANGLRLQYVPTEIKAIRYSSSSTRYLVPEYLYWQNGYVYVKIKTYVNSEYDNGYVIGSVQDSNFPNNYTTGKTVSRTSYNSWSSSSLGTIVGTSTISPAGSPVWFAGTASPSVVPIINWMQTGK